LGCFQAGFGVLLLKAIDGGNGLALFLHGISGFGGGLAFKDDTAEKTFNHHCHNLLVFGATVSKRAIVFPR